jgi:hypothetical protein
MDRLLQREHRCQRDRSRASFDNVTMPSVELDKEPAIRVRQLGPALHLAPQYYQLLPERGILRLKSTPRPEGRCEDRQKKTD